MRALSIIVRVVWLLPLLNTNCVSTRPFTDAEDQIIPDSLALMETHMIGGIRQSIWFRGIDRRNPILILLHGGPGASESALFRHYNADLERHFLMVSWEQRGTGRSFETDIPPESMTIERFLTDLDEVVDLVRHRFGKENVVLLGHSWGTVLGTLYASRHPDKVAVYVGTGQVADMSRGERRSYEYALTEAAGRGRGQALSELQAIGPPPHSVGEMLISGKWVERFGGTFHGDLSTGKLIWAALMTDEANVMDLIRFGRGNRFSLEHLWNEYRELDLTGYRTFHVPLFFLLGRYDEVTPSVLAQAYLIGSRRPANGWYGSNSRPITRRSRSPGSSMPR